MTAKELQEQINTLQRQLDSLSKQLADLEVLGIRGKIKKKIKEFFIFLRNLVSWFWPPGVIFIFIASTYFLLHISWKEFIELIRILMWPVTILTALFFFRKIFTYLFLSMEEFNFFGLKGKFNNVQDVINEKARELRDREKIEEERGKKLEIYKKEIEKNQKLIQNLISAKDTGSKQWSNLAQKILNDYKELKTAYNQLYAKYTEKLKQEEEAKIRKEAIRKLIEERGREKRNLPF